MIFTILIQSYFMLHSALSIISLNFKIVRNPLMLQHYLIIKEIELFLIALEPFKIDSYFTCSTTFFH